MLAVTGLCAALSCKTARNKSNIYLYQYSNEGLAFYNMHSLSSTDSTEKLQPFFNRKELQTLSTQTSCKVKVIQPQTFSDTLFSFFYLSDVELKINDKVVNESTLLQQINHPILVATSLLGSIYYVQLDTALSFENKQLVMGVISNFQFNRDSNKTASNEWDIEEKNTIGSYIAHYKVLSSYQNKTDYEKKKVNYIESNYLSNKGQDLQVNSISKFTINKNGRINNATTSESLASTFNGDTISISGSKVIIESEKQYETNNDTIQDYLKTRYSSAYTTYFTLNIQLPKEVIRKMQNEKTVGTATFESLVAKARLSLSDAEINSLRLQLRALLSLRPDNILDIEKILESETKNSKSFNIFLFSLLWVNNPQSTNTIIRLIDKGIIDEETFITILPTLVTSSKPTKEEIIFFKTLSSNSTDTSIKYTSSKLALASIVRNYKNIDEAFYNQMEKFIIDTLVKNTDADLRLSILGNLGSVKSYSTLVNQINDTTFPMRQRVKSVYSLRFIDHDSIPIFLNKWTENKDSAIIKMAIETIKIRKQRKEAINK